MGVTDKTAKFLQDNQESKKPDSNGKNKRKIYFISIYLLIMIIIFSIAGIIMYFMQESNPAQPINDTEIKPETVPEPLSVEIEEQNTIYCNQYIDAQDRLGCTFEVEFRKQITGEEKKIIWTAMRQRSFEVCDTMTGEAKIVCKDAETLMIQIEEIPDCENLQNNYMKEYCKGTLYYIMAVDGKNPSLCEKMTVPFGYWKRCQGEFT